MATNLANIPPLSTNSANYAKGIIVDIRNVVESTVSVGTFIRSIPFQPQSGLFWSFPIVYPSFVGKVHRGFTLHTH